MKRRRSIATAILEAARSAPLPALRALPEQPLALDPDKSARDLHRAASKSTSDQITARASTTRTPAGSMKKRPGRSRRLAFSSAWRCTRPTAAPPLSARVALARLGLDPLDLTDRVGRDRAVADGQPHNTGDYRSQFFAGEALTSRLIDAMTLSTSGHVASPSRTSPIAGSTWFRSWRRESSPGQPSRHGRLRTPDQRPAPSTARDRHRRRLRRRRRQKTPTRARANPRPSPSLCPSLCGWIEA